MSLERERKTNHGQPCHFLDLPVEIRLMVYENLLDRRVDVISSEADTDIFLIRLAYVEESFYPSLLRVNKQINSEYSTIAFREAWLAITYTIDEYPIRDEDTPNSDHDPLFPLVSRIVSIPSAALARLSGVVFRYELEGEIPIADPFFGIAHTVEEMLGIKRFIIWTVVKHSLIEPSVRGNPHEIRLFRKFTERLFEADMEVFELKEDTDRGFYEKAECQLFCPLYALNNKTIDSQGHASPKAGCVPAPGLPPYEYVVFDVHNPMDSPVDDAFV